MKAKKLVLKQKSFVWALIISALMYQNVIMQYIAPFKYFDEIIALICLFYFVLEVYKTRITKTDIKIALVLVAMCALGFCGNFFSDVQVSLKNQLLDAFNIFKFIMTIWGAILYFRKYSTKKYLLYYLTDVIKVSVLVSTFFMVLNLFQDIGMHTDYIWGIRTYNFVFERVGEFYSVCVMWLVILTAKQYYGKNKSDAFFAILIMLNMCSTLRTRAFAYVVAFVVLYYILIKKKTIKVRWYYILLLMVVMYIVGKDKIAYYLLRDNAARSVLLRYGIVTAMTYFPLGAGFGTYGTAVARDTYSKLYDRYNFQSIWGLDEGEGFLTDNYWPAIMGEFGFFGMILNIILLYMVVQKLLRETDNIYSRLCVYFAISTLLISSVASSAFLASVRLFLIVCMVCRLDYSPRENKVIR